LCVAATVLFGGQLAREYRVWRLSRDPSLILETAMAPPGDDWRSALGELLSREYPPGVWRPRPGTLRPAVVFFPNPNSFGTQTSVKDKIYAQDLFRYLSDQTGAIINAVDGLITREVWTTGLIKVLDVDLARAILHARGIAVLEFNHDFYGWGLWAVDRSELCRGEHTTSDAHGGSWCVRDATR
jgi:hypothetical protein